MTIKQIRDALKEKGFKMLPQSQEDQTEGIWQMSALIGGHEFVSNSPLTREELEYLATHRSVPTLV